MKKTAIIAGVSVLIDSIGESLTHYEREEKDGHRPQAGYGVNMEDSKESIQRRILAARQLLLQVSKMMDEGR